MPLLDDRAIMITGGTGSFGRAFVRYLLTHTNARRIIIFSRDEQKQDTVARDMQALDSKARLRFFIGDVRDESRLELAMRDLCHVRRHPAGGELSLCGVSDPTT